MLWEQYKYRAIPVKSVLAHGWQITLLAVGRSESVKAPATAAAREHGWCESANPPSIRELSSPASRRIGSSPFLHFLNMYLEALGHRTVTCNQRFLSQIARLSAR